MKRAGRKSEHKKPAFGRVLLLSQGLDILTLAAIIKASAQSSSSVYQMSVSAPHYVT